MHRLATLLHDQDGVVCRRQVRALGVGDPEIRRWVRRRELAVVHPGVYVAHTGPLTWHQRAWAAVLHAWPAALAGPSALRAADGPGRVGEEAEAVHVAVDRSRSLVEPPGVRIVRTYGLRHRALWNTNPPRMRYEEAALDLALAAEDELDMIATLARAVQKRHTTAARLADTLGNRTRAPRRDLVRGVLEDVAHGTCSVLEHGYLTRVERAHGMLAAERQQRGTCSLGVVYRDAAYGGLIVELDGRLFHDTVAQRDADVERDLDAALDGRETVRLSWGQVFGRPCSTADKVSRLLVARGWPAARPCGPGCAVAAAA